MSCFLFCVKQKTAYEMRISDWSSDVCSSDLLRLRLFKLLFDGCAIARQTLNAGRIRCIKTAQFLIKAFLALLQRLQLAVGFALGLCHQSELLLDPGQYTTHFVPGKRRGPHLAFYNRPEARRSGQRGSSTSQDRRA